MEDTEFFLKKLWKRFMKKIFQIGNRVLQVRTKTLDQTGNCIFCRRELSKTVMELPAMAAAASSGLIQPIIASRMVRVLYSRERLRFCRMVKPKSLSEGLPKKLFFQ